MPTATGPYSLQLDAVRDAVANSSTFQSRCGVSTAAEALLRVRLQMATDEALALEAQRPFAVVRDNSYAMRSIGRSAGGHDLSASGTFQLLLTDNYRGGLDQSDLSHDEHLIDYLNFRGGVLEDLVEAMADYFVFERVEGSLTFRLPFEDRSGGDYWWSVDTLIGEGA